MQTMIEMTSPLKPVASRPVNAEKYEEAGGDEESSETTDDGSPRDPVQ